jgi:hypothetical protein
MIYKRTFYKLVVTVALSTVTWLSIQSQSPVMAQGPNLAYQIITNNKTRSWHLQLIDIETGYPVKSEDMFLSDIPTPPLAALRDGQYIQVYRDQVTGEQSIAAFSTGTLKLLHSRSLGPGNPVIVAISPHFAVLSDSSLVRVSDDLSLEVVAKTPHLRVFDWLPATSHGNRMTYIGIDADSKVVIRTISTESGNLISSPEFVGGNAFFSISYSESGVLYGIAYDVVGFYLAQIQPETGRSAKVKHLPPLSTVHLSGGGISGGIYYLPVVSSMGDSRIWGLNVATGEVATDIRAVEWFKGMSPLAIGAFKPAKVHRVYLPTVAE